jgi:hypothetical protein
LDPAGDQNGSAARRRLGRATVDLAVLVRRRFGASDGGRGARRRRRPGWTARPPTTMPTAIISPCHATVTGPISIVGSMPIVITDTAVTARAW